MESSISPARERLTMRTNDVLASFCALPEQPWRSLPHCRYAGEYTTTASAEQDRRLEKPGRGMKFTESSHNIRILAGGDPCNFYAGDV